MSEWISVKDRLPAQNAEVLFYGALGVGIGPYVGCYGRGAFWAYGKGVVQIDGVTYWMPMPPPPPTDSPA